MVGTKGRQDLPLGSLGPSWRTSSVIDSFNSGYAGLAANLKATLRNSEECELARFTPRRPRFLCSGTANRGPGYQVSTSNRHAIRWL